MASSDLQHALDLMTGRWRSQILHAGVKLGVFDAIGGRVPWSGVNPEVCDLIAAW